MDDYPNPERGLTLQIRHEGGTALRFVLLGLPTAGVREATIPLRPELQQHMARAFKEFARCVAGFQADEPKCAELGQVLFRLFLPQSIWAQISALECPLTIQTNNPSLPWELLHDGVEFLALRLPVARQLIARDEMADLLRPPTVGHKEFRSLIIADPCRDLPGARREGEALREFLSRFGPCEFLPSATQEATPDVVLRELVRAPYSIIHYCGHVDWHPKERTSSVRLRGGRLLPDDLRPIFTGCPVVFLNACRSDRRQPQSSRPKPADSFARNESFADAFLWGNPRGLASAVVGAMWDVPDEPEEAGAKFARTYYQCLLDGGTIGEALRASRLMARQEHWGPMVWAPYVLYGDATLAPFRNERRQHPLHRSKDQLSDPLKQELSAADALDAGAREILHVAVREMKRMEQTTLSSLHLLIGLSRVGIHELSQALAAKGITPEQLCEEARHRAQQLIPADQEEFGISRSVLLILVQASRSSKRAARSEICAADLWSGLLQCDRCEAMQILASQGLVGGKGANASQGGEPVSTKSLSLSKPPLRTGENRKADERWRFNKQSRAVMRRAFKFAQEAHLEYLGTPHLLMGLIGIGSIHLIEMLRQRKVDIDLLCQALLDGMGKGESGKGNGNGKGGNLAKLQIRPRCIAILDRAQAIAGSESMAEISELHLVQALLEEQEGYTAEILRRLGADPAELLDEFMRAKNKPKL